MILGLAIVVVIGLILEREMLNGLFPYNYNYNNNAPAWILRSDHHHRSPPFVSSFWDENSPRVIRRRVSPHWITIQNEDSSSDEDEEDEDSTIRTSIPSSVVANNTTTIQLLSDGNNENNKEDKQNRTLRTLVFMHVGKTGGRNILFNVLHFRTKVQGSKINALSKQTKGVIHLSQQQGIPIANATDLLFTIREPLARLESWYQFSSPHNCVKNNIERHANCRAQQQAEIDPRSFVKRFYYDCFPTLAQMAQALDPKYYYYDQNPKDCKTLLRDAFETVGISDDYSHLSAGYRFYWNQVVPLETEDGRQEQRIHHPKRRIWAIRTEWLWHDVQVIEHAMGGKEDFSFLKDTKYTHGSEHYRHKSGLLVMRDGDNDHSSQNYNNNDDDDNMIIVRVCCALWPELLAYREIMEHAENLNTAQQLETYQLTWKRCQVSSWEMLEKQCHSLGTILTEFN